MNWDRLMRIDRRVIFLCTAVVIMLPLIFPFELPTGIQRPTRALFDTVDHIDRSKQCLMICTDYVPQTEAENQPMTVALLRHAFAARIPVLVAAMYIEGAGLPRDAILKTMAEFNARARTSADSIKYGRDVDFLGWQPPPIVPILGMGKSIAESYPVDFEGMKTDSLPIMRHIHNYDQVGILCSISAGPMPGTFVAYAETKFGVRIGAGVTAVSVPDLYPLFEKTHQLAGLMGGMKGASEYEFLVKQKYGVGGRMRATEGMGAQSAAHLMIIAFVVIGNVAYFAGRRKKS